MKTSNKIGIVVLRLGEFDNYINYWIESASANTKIDFVIFTDNESFINQHKNIPNFVFYKITKDDIKQRLSKLVGENASLEKPYKLCDYKPSYGELFKEELKCYDYWGFCDTDLIFGDIWNFVKDKLYEYDRLYNLGHLNLFRNIDSVNRLFLKHDPTIKHLTFDMAIKEDENIYFDEYFGLNKIWDNSKQFTQYLSDKDFADINMYSYRLKRTDDKCLYFYKYESGKLFEINSDGIREVLYVHLQKRKISFETIIPGKPFYLINTHIGYYEENDALKEFKKKRVLKGFFYFVNQKRKYYLNRWKRKKYIKKSAKTDFYKICY